MTREEMYIQTTNDLIVQFEHELISYDDFILELSNFSAYQIELMGIDSYFQWLSIRRDYVAFKRFNCNKEQITLF